MFLNKSIALKRNSVYTTVTVLVLIIDYNTRNGGIYSLLFLVIYYLNIIKYTLKRIGNIANVFQRQKWLIYGPLGEFGFDITTEFSF